MSIYEGCGGCVVVRRCDAQSARVRCGGSLYRQGLGVPFPVQGGQVSGGVPSVIAGGPSLEEVPFFFFFFCGGGGGGGSCTGALGD